MLLLLVINNLVFQWVKYVQTVTVSGRGSKSFVWTYPIALQNLPYYLGGASAGQYAAFYFSFEEEKTTSCRLISNNSVDVNRDFWSVYGMIIGS